MRAKRFIFGLIGMLLGAGLFVFAEIDDSHGGQLIGVLVVGFSVYQFVRLFR